MLCIRSAEEAQTSAEKERGEAEVAVAEVAVAVAGVEVEKAGAAAVLEEVEAQAAESALVKAEAALGVYLRLKAALRDSLFVVVGHILPLGATHAIVVCGNSDSSFQRVSPAGAHRR